MEKRQHLERIGNKTKFSKDNQPSKLAKVEGKRQSYLLKDIAKHATEGELRKAQTGLADFLGVSVDELDIESTMHLVQIKKALDGDTQAYKSVMNRILGSPRKTMPVVESGIKTINSIRYIDATKK
ncbi:hypothetical protein GH721_16245 [Kriegella sp. EG-1]|nr:hypothetical protein [Flavobacteriaceae bacterium EG-1]